MAPTLGTTDRVVKSGHFMYGSCSPERPQQDKYCHEEPSLLLEFTMDRTGQNEKQLPRTRCGAELSEKEEEI